MGTFFAESEDWHSYRRTPLSVTQFSVARRAHFCIRMQRCCRRRSCILFADHPCSRMCRTCWPTSAPRTCLKTGEHFWHCSLKLRLKARGCTGGFSTSVAAEPLLFGSICRGLNLLKGCAHSMDSPFVVWSSGAMWRLRGVFYD